jgi:Lytic transglycolase
MNFFGLFWVLYIGSMGSAISYANLWKLPHHWSGSFLGKATAAGTVIDRPPLHRAASSHSSPPAHTTWLSSLPLRWNHVRPISSTVIPNYLRFQNTVAQRSAIPVMRFAQNLVPWSHGIQPYLRAAIPVTVVRANRRASATSSQECGQSLLRQRRQTQSPIFQLWVNGHWIAEFSKQTEADLIAQRLRQFLQSESFDPDRLYPSLMDNTPVGMAGSSLLFVVNEQLATTLNRNAELIAIDWTNNLRTALDGSPLSLAEAQTRMYGLVETGESIAGTASWYGPYFHGRLTATGEIFDQGELTAAHPSLPFNTFLKVTNLESGKTVIVRVNDRGPYVGTRSLDLSREAARCIESEMTGVVSYKAEVMQPLARAGVPIAQPRLTPPQAIARRL